MKKAFTLIELLTAIIIVAILAAIAIPNYFKMVERGRSAEAVTILGALRGAQVRYYHAHQTYADLDINALDIEPSQNKYFDFAVWNASAAGSCTEAIASATRNTEENINFGSYTLCVELSDGKIKCADEGASEAGSVCSSLGYSE